jgi:Mg-chelatase subunit ChlD
VAILSLIDEAPAAFTITDPEGSVHAFPSLAPPASGAAPVGAAHNYAPPSGFDRQDRVTIEREGGDTVTDPRRRTCTITFSLNTDFDPEDSCASIMPVASEDWQVSVSGTEISGICHVSLTRNSGTGCIGADAEVVISPAVTSDLATINGQFNQECSLDRPGADIYLVLDRSGSMSSSSQLGGSPLTRMDALHQAVQSFVQVWEDIIAPSDQLGIVIFDDVVETPPWIGAGLQSFSAALEDTVVSNITSVTPRNLTSIGGGLLEAANTISAAPPSRRRIILLMSDGQQNTDPHVGANPPATPDAPPTYDVFTYNEATPASTTPLPGLGTAPYQIYTVTTGPGVGVAGALNTNIARATGGFYLNSEDNGNLLSPFFLELLGNFARFNSWQVARMVHGSLTEMYTITLPLSTTTQRAVFVLSWPQPNIVMNMRVIPPGTANDPESQFNQEDIISPLHIAVDTRPWLDPLEEWTVVLTYRPSSALSRRESSISPEFDLVVLVDDLAVKSDLAIVPADYTPGDTIQLRVRLRTFGEPTDLPAATEDDNRVVAQVIRPGQNIGDLLSESTASTEPPSADYRNSPLESRLFNELQRNPDALRRTTNTIVLQRTGPGLYTGTIGATFEGHYNVLFGVEGMSNGAGRFSRQELRSIYVRVVPDESATDVQTTLADGLLTIQFTPRTRTRGRMGPGWANYFWFTAPGQAPFKSSDNMNGTYTARMRFSGTTPPPVTMHFVDVLQIIGDDVTADQLPRPLDERSAFIPTLKGTGNRVDTVSPEGCLKVLVKLIKQMFGGANK